MHRRRQATDAGGGAGGGAGAGGERRIGRARHDGLQRGADRSGGEGGAGVVHVAVVAEDALAQRL